MTQAATEHSPLRNSQRLASLSVGLRSPSPAVRYGIRWGAALALALLLGHGQIFGYGLPQPSWLMITILFVTLPGEGASIQKATYRIVGTIGAALAAILIWGVGAQSPAVELTGIFVAYALGIYWMVGPRSQYIGSVFAFTTGTILGSSYPFADGQIEVVAFERAGLVILGVVIVFVVESVLWPSRASDSLRDALANATAAIRDRLADCLAAMQTGRRLQPIEVAPSTLTSELPLVERLRVELGVGRLEADASQRATLLLEAIRLRAGQLHEVLSALPERTRSETFRNSLGDLREALCKAMDAAIDSLRGERLVRFADPVRTAWARLRDESIELVEGQLANDEQGAAPERSRRDGIRALRVGPILRDIVEMIARLESELMIMNGAAAAGSEEQRLVTRPRGPRLRVDPYQLQLALRGSLAVVVSLLLIAGTGWGSTSLVMTIAFMFAISPTFRAAKGGVMLLLQVVLVGSILADISIVYLIPHLQRMPLALIFPFGVMLALGYLAVKRPRPFATAAGLYGVIILPPIFAPPSAPLDVYGPYSTATYMLLGSGAALFAARTFWPTTSTRLFWRRSAGQLDACRQLFELARSPAGDDARAAELASAYTSQLANLTKLHAEAQQDPDNQPADDERRAQLLTRVQSVFDAALHLRSCRAPDLDAARDRATRELIDLQDALARQGVAVGASLQRAISSLDGEAPEASDDLSEAQRAVLDHCEPLIGRRELAEELGAQKAAELLTHVDAAGLLASAQLDIEEWIREWRATTASDSAAEPRRPEEPACVC